MKKIAVIFTGLLVILIGAALIAPSFVNWNDYKAEIEAQAEKLTGRKLTISGDISAALLPAPALSVEGVTLSNALGGRAENFASLKSAEVRVALGPLLGGAIQVTTVRLEEPVIHLETYKNGANWEFALNAGGAAESGAADGGGDSGAGAGGDGGGSGLAEIRLDDFTITDGTLVYYDAVTGEEERIEGVSANIRAASLAGPFEVEGELTARATPLTFDITVGQIIHGRTVSVNAELGAGGDGDASLNISGTVAGMADAPRFKGRIRGEGENLGGLIARLSGADGAAALAMPFKIDAEIQGDTKSASLSELRLELGDEAFTGAVEAELGDVIRFSAELSAGRIDADAIAELMAPEKKSGGGGGDDKNKDEGADETAGASAAVPSARIPDNINGSLALSAEAVIFKGEKVGPVRFNAEIGGGEITVSQISASFPGGGDIAAFGFLTAPKGKLLFDGEIEARASDLRAAMKWLDITPPPVADGRLRAFSYRSNLAVTPEQVQLSGVKMTVDASNITGGVTVALRKRSSFGANLAVDKLNLDAYLPQSAGAGGSGSGAGSEDSSGAGSEDSGGGAGGGAETFKALAVLNTFDANLKLRAGQLTYRGAAVKDARLDATVAGGAVTIRDFSVKQIAGAGFALKGGISELSGLPKVKNLNLKFTAPKLGPVFALAGQPVPPAAAALGAVGADVTIDGALSAPSFSAAVEAAGGRLTAQGKAAILDPSPGVSAQVTFEHADLNAFLKKLGGYRPAGRLGAVKISAGVTAGASEARLEKISGLVSGAEISGAVTARYGRGARPVIEAGISTGALNIQAFMPAEQTAGVWPGGPGLNAWSAERRKVRTLNRRWSKDPIDFSALGAADVTLTLKSQALAWGGAALRDADIAAALNGGVLKTQRVKGTIFGGAFGAQMMFDSNTGAAAFETSLKGADLKAASKASGGPDASGRAAMTAKLTAQGRSPADFVSALNGQAGIQLSGVDVKGSGDGMALSGFLNIARGMGGLGAALSGGGGGKSPAIDVSAAFDIKNGVAVTDNIKIVSEVASGAGAGAFDLPAWRMDMSGEVTLASGALGGLLGAAGGDGQKPISFRVAGPIDAPKVTGFKLGGALSNLLKNGLQGLKDKKGGGGLINALGGILGLPQDSGETQQPQQQKQQQQQPQQQEQQPQPQPEKKKITPKDALGTIFDVLRGKK